MLWTVCNNHKSRKIEKNYKESNNWYAIISFSYNYTLFCYCPLYQFSWNFVWPLHKDQQQNSNDMLHTLDCWICKDKKVCLYTFCRYWLVYFYKGGCLLCLQKILILLINQLQFIKICIIDKYFSQITFKII